MVVINKTSYCVKEGEYLPLLHREYNNLKLFQNLALHERILGFLNRCATLCPESQSRFFSFHTTHGGFIPLNLESSISQIFLLETEEQHRQNIQTNLATVNHKNNFRIPVEWSFQNIPTDNESTEQEDNDMSLDILYIDHLQQTSAFHHYLQTSNRKKWIVVSNGRLWDDNTQPFNLTNTNVWVFVAPMLRESFRDIFRFYLHEGETIPQLTFDNLIHLCIMVKNGGTQFEQMLQDNLPLIDRWTILDTGSTDDTLQIIDRVLVGKKEGTLFQEPFINFRDSRNRLLELAGTSCKYILMMDDTYVVKGNLREFLQEVRSDQYASSFTLMIHSDDTCYGSNRVLKSNAGLQYMYRIHEVICDKNNINVVIPETRAYLEDRRFDYMETRTQERKALDLQLLNEELQDDINNPRTYYYLAQTYNCLKQYDKAFYFFMKRCEFTNSGFIQERVDAAFEAARLANFKLHKPWDFCEKLYEAAFKIDETRPESQYFLGIHYYLENNYEKAYPYFKRAFDIGFPAHCQYSLKPTLSFHFLPKFLARVCYGLDKYLVGEKACELFLLKNPPTADDYQEMASWYKIYQKLNVYRGAKVPTIPAKPIFCFVADGGFHPWSGSNILTTGVGGSETYIIEMARYIQRQGEFDVYVFCNTPSWIGVPAVNFDHEIFEGVHYRHLDSYYHFINTHYVKHTIVSRFSEYLPVTFKGFTENVYFVIHDLTPSGVLIPMDKKLKRVFCLTEWHVSYFTNIFKDLVPITVPFYYGIDDKFKEVEPSKKIKHKFIYSSFPNRGLLQLLQMWPVIYTNYPTATLHIFADVNHKWSNDVEPEKMTAIKVLLQSYQTTPDHMGIHYHGWVSKAQLAEAWATSDIWFYPCTFMETFCLTALEAASSQTLCVTNHLAALQNTVGERGVIIHGDATTEEWQSRALTQLLHIMKDANAEEKQRLVDLNYRWSQTLSWESQAHRMLREHIAPNEELEYKGMYNWTNDLPKGSKEMFDRVLDSFNRTYSKIQFGKPISVMEIGTYAGVSLIELVKSIPNATGVGIDRWKNYPENSLLSVMDNFQVKESFHRNVQHAGMQGRITGIQMDSTTALLTFVEDKRKFDFIYLDGSHRLLDCYSDLVLSWQVLEPGGILVIDDYQYKRDEDPTLLQSPYEAVNHFLKVYKERYKTLSVGYRVFLQKTM